MANFNRLNHVILSMGTDVELMVQCNSCILCKWLIGYRETSFTKAQNEECACAQIIINAVLMTLLHMSRNYANVKVLRYLTVRRLQRVAPYDLRKGRWSP